MSFILLDGQEPDEVRTGVVSAHFFDLLGIKPYLGRFFTSADDVPGADAVLVLSYPYWQTRYGGDRSIIGRHFRMNDKVHTVVGVLPPVPQYPRENDVYMPTVACPFRSSPRRSQAAMRALIAGVWAAQARRRCKSGQCGLERGGLAAATSNIRRTILRPAACRPPWMACKIS